MLYEGFKFSLRDEVKDKNKICNRLHILFYFYKYWVGCVVFNSMSLQKHAFTYKSRIYKCYSS